LVPLPSTLASGYRPATTREIRSWSFGQVTARRRTAAVTWRDQLGTLDDQRIFGPLQEFACACGKYKGSTYKGMICDICGVKVTTPAVRRERFGHIEFACAAQHPLADTTHQIDAFPVLPAAFLCSISGRKLADTYESLVESAAHGALTPPDLAALVEILLPVVQIAHEWSLTESALLARGLALESREPS
jgi:hypothetical protein